MGNCCTAKVLSDSEPLQSPPGVKETTVCLQRKPGEPIGLDLDFMDGRSARVLEVLDGLVRESGVKVKEGDYITSVNGVRGVAGIRKCLRNDAELRIVLAHVQEFTIKVTKGSGLGIDFTYAPQGDSLLVQKVLNVGSIYKWNTDKAGLEVKSKDRIVAVNGCRGKWSKLLEEVQGAKETEELSLTISPAPPEPTNAPAEATVSKDPFEPGEDLQVDELNVKAS
mmetsp:Transcript_15870/g.37114  ORF Transcript_15870/g.37114 Transcript_15870/m.37114 type:complete len:224 (+) Transcript_15870:69-740(+)